MDIDWSNAPQWATHWCESKSVWVDDSLDTVASCCIPRPTTPAAPEWDGASAKHIGMKFKSSLGVCELMAIDSNNVTCCVRFVDSGHLQFCSLDALEPIRTKEQRQREELSDLITDNIKVDYTDGNFYIDDDKAVNAIIAAGWTKP